MKSPLFSVFTVILLLTLVFVSAGATEVVLRDGVLIAEDQNDEYGIGAFNIVLVYGPDVSIVSDEWVKPYSGAINIQNPDGITRIAGLTTSSNAPKGNVSLIQLGVNGSGKVTVYVNEFYNTMGDPIETVNPSYEGNATEPTLGDVTPTSVTTTVAEGSGETAQGSGGQSTVLTGSAQSTSPVQTTTPSMTEEPIQISTTQDVETGVTSFEGSEANSSSNPEPTKSSLDMVFVILSLFVSFMVFQSIYKRRN